MQGSDIHCSAIYHRQKAFLRALKPTAEEDACLLNCGFALLAFKRSLVQEDRSLFLTLKNSFWLILYHEHYCTNMHNVSKLQSIENIETVTYSLETNKTGTGRCKVQRLLY
jgi:hypothetical protein